MVAIQSRGVTKAYRGVTALQGIDLAVERGEVLGFLGPNGAGKSTTIDILLRYTHPTTGRVEVLAPDVWPLLAVRPRLANRPRWARRRAQRVRTPGVGFAVAVLLGWIVLVPIAGYIRFDRTDL